MAKFYDGWITHLPFGDIAVLVWGDRRIARREARRRGWRFQETLPRRGVRHYTVEAR